MTGASAVGETVVGPASGNGFAKRRVGLIAGIAVVLFAVAFGVGSAVKSHPATQVSSPSLAATTPAAGSSPLAIVRAQTQAAAVPALRRPVHKAAKTTSTASGGQAAVTSTSQQLTSTTPAAAVQTPTAPLTQTHTTQAQTSTSGGGLSGGSS